MLSDEVTVCIFAYNEEARLLRCIQNFRSFFRILVVDNCSTDATVAVAEAANCDVVSVKNPGYIETDEVMRPVLAACKTPYVLIASVSEFVPVALVQKYADVANAASHDVVRAYRESVTAGLDIPISGPPGRCNPGEIRFFRKGAIDYAGTKVHDRGRVVVDPSRVLSLLDQRIYYFYQFRDYDASHTERKHGGYNDVLARQRFDGGERFGWLRLIFLPLKQFVNCYLRFGAWKFGMPGFIQSYYRWQMEVGILLRIWEWQHDFHGAAVVDRNDKVRREMEAALPAAGALASIRHGKAE